MPRLLRSALVALGWSAIAVRPDILHRGGTATVVLLIPGDIVYTWVRSAIALKWPNPWPRTFAHHEYFLAATVVAAICHNVAIYLRSSRECLPRRSQRVHRAATRTLPAW